MTSVALSARQTRRSPLSSTPPPPLAPPEPPSEAGNRGKLATGKAGPAARPSDQRGGRSWAYARIEANVRSTRAGRIDRKSGGEIECFIAMVCAFLMLFIGMALHAARIFLSLRVLPTGSSLFVFAGGGKSGQQRAMYRLS